MDVKRIFRGPVIYILIAVAVVWIGTSLLSGTGFRQVTTAQGRVREAHDDRACVIPRAVRDPDSRVSRIGGPKSHQPPASPGGGGLS